MTARVLLSRQVEESQRKSQEARNREQKRNQDVLAEKASERNLLAEKAAKLKALRLAKEAKDLVSASEVITTTKRTKSKKVKLD